MRRVNVKTRPAIGLPKTVVVPSDHAIVSPARTSTKNRARTLAYWPGATFGGVTCMIAIGILASTVSVAVAAELMPVAEAVTS